MKYRHGVAAGTFDHLHKGHEVFLQKAIHGVKKLTLGITSDEFIRDKSFPKSLESYEKRVQNVRIFLKACGLLKSVSVVKIHSPFIPRELESQGIDVIFVTNSTKKTAMLINEKRKTDGLSPLAIEVIPFVVAQDGFEITSSRIRGGEINREGKFYIHPDWFKKTLFLPESLREVLRKPFGELIINFEAHIKNHKLEGKYIITVGDVVTKASNNLGLNQMISCVDFHVEREKKYSNISELGFDTYVKTYTASNPAGLLSPMLFKNIYMMFAQINEADRMVLQIDGEEDLSLLVFVLAAPLGFIAFYGQPHQGVVKVEVNESNKKKVFDIVSRFIPA